MMMQPPAESSFKYDDSSMEMETSMLAFSLKSFAASSPTFLASSTSDFLTLTVTFGSISAYNPSSMSNFRMFSYLLESCDNLTSAISASLKIVSKASSLVARILSLVLLAMVDLVICCARDAFLNLDSYCESMALISDRTIDAFSISYSSSAFNLISFAFSSASLVMNASIFRSSP
ncbi:hypothetical protein OGATHE_003368 [Ogataea polymorpha]|uniref:Uncharacterized protein n=1 Tax=Ogataea polymorpha TaxID=460523 RepID=A0A9P8P2E4_9ASCO|nr:hypothetical protein OGATHE_003368 [Ogataea polymorpha]